jgi:hypothetical protein
LLLRFGDGELPATVEGAEPPATPPPVKVERGRSRAYVPPQPNLFD